MEYTGIRSTKDFRSFSQSASHEKWEKVTLDYLSRPENDLIEACKKGDMKAQLQVYKSYYKQMFNFSFKVVGNACDADEIVRESFMIVFGSTGDFKGMTDFISRLKGLVESRSSETWRKKNVSSPGLTTDRPLIQ